MISAQIESDLIDPSPEEAQQFLLDAAESISVSFDESRGAAGKFKLSFTLAND